LEVIVRYWTRIIILGLLLLMSSAAMATEEPVDMDLVLVRAPEGNFAVLELTPHPGWHAYANTPGSSGFPTRVDARLDGTLLAPLYPPGIPTPDPLSPGATALLYTGTTPIFLPLPQVHGELQVAVRTLLCSDTTCQPVRRKLQTRITEAALAAARTPQDTPWWDLYARSLPEAEQAAPTPPQAQTTPQPGPLESAFVVRVFDPGLEVHSLATAVPLALVAGLLLNLMPCVLPVIGLKLRGLMPTAHETSPSRAFRVHNLAFAAGIISFFCILALAIGATGMAWGQIFQNPNAITALAILVFLLAMSLFGLLNLPLLNLKSKPRPEGAPGALDSFTTGLLATVLATPCSGPFLGGVLAWTLIQPPLVIVTVLACAGIGMASPYLVLAAVPGLMRIFPRPGAWMEYLETGLGFFLLGTTIYLLGLLPQERVVPTLAFLWICAICAWMWGRWGGLQQSPYVRLFWRSTALGVAALCAWIFLVPTTTTTPWQPFDRQRFEALRHTTPLLLDFTADWCPNCKFLEKTVLTAETSSTIAQRYGAVLMRVDLTREDPQNMALLAALGSRSIPLLAIFSPTRPNSPLILRDLFSQATLERALEQEWEGLPPNQ
jgi:thiol:disulfide interchange protein DsbD